MLYIYCHETGLFSPYWWCCNSNAIVNPVLPVHCHDLLCHSSVVVQKLLKHITLPNGWPVPLWPWALLSITSFIILSVAETNPQQIYPSPTSWLNVATILKSSCFFEMITTKIHCYMFLYQTKPTQLFFFYLFFCCLIWAPPKALSVYIKQVHPNSNWLQSKSTRKIENTCVHMLVPAMICIFSRNKKDFGLGTVYRLRKSQYIRQILFVLVFSLIDTEGKKKCHLVAFVQHDIIMSYVSASLY